MGVKEIKKEIEKKEPEVLKKARLVLPEKEIDRIISTNDDYNIEDCISKIKSATVETALIFGSLEQQINEAENADDTESILNNRFL